LPFRLLNLAASVPHVDSNQGPADYEGKFCVERRPIVTDANVTPASLGPDEIDEYALVAVAQVGQVV